jgi:hypothetical protein
MLYHRHLRKPLKAEGRVGAASLVTTKMLAFIASMQAVVGLGREYGLEWKVFGSRGGGRGGGVAFSFVVLWSWALRAKTLYVIDQSVGKWVKNAALAFWVPQALPEALAGFSP